MHLDQPVAQPHRDQPEPQATRQRSVLLQRLRKAPPLAPGHRQVDQIGQRQPRHALVEQSQREAGLHLDDHRLLRAAQGHHIGRADLGFHLVALALQKGADGGV